MNRSWLSILMVLPLVAFDVQRLAAQTATAPMSIEDEVLTNLRNQPIGPGQTLDNYQIPEQFLRVITDRAIRTSFEDRYRIVVRDQPGGTSDADSDRQAEATAPARSRAVRWLGLIILLPVGIAGIVLMLRRRKALR